MARTPDEFPGERIDDLVLIDSGTYVPSINGEFAYVSGSGFRFMDEGVLKGLSGLSQNEHEYLNTLTHDPAWNSFDDVLYGTYGMVTMSVWADQTRTNLMQHYEVEYNNSRLMSVLTSSVYISGSLVAQMTETPTYDSRKRIINIVRNRLL
jgi:hypothetical protein